MTSTPRARFGSERGHQAALGRGIALMLGCTLLLTANDAIMKLLAESYPIGQIIFARGALALLLLLGWTMLAAGGRATLRVHDYPGVLTRGVLMVVSTYLFIGGLHLLPLVTATAVSFTGPLITAVLAIPFLGERIGPRRALAILVGFLGVVVMVRPTGEVVQWAVLLPLGAVICGSFRDLLTRRLTTRESSLAILIWSTGMVAAGGLASWPFGWAPWQAADLPLIAAAAALLAGAHFCQIEAFRFAAASLIAPYRYSALIWGALFGFLLWAEVPGPWMLAGTALIVAAGLYLWKRGSA